MGVEGVVWFFYLCATRRRRAEGRSGGAEMDPRQHGGVASIGGAPPRGSGAEVGGSVLGEARGPQAELLLRLAVVEAPRSTGNAESRRRWSPAPTPGMRRC